MFNEEQIYKKVVEPFSQKNIDKIKFIKNIENNFKIYNTSEKDKKITFEYMWISYHILLFTNKLNKKVIDYYRIFEKNKNKSNRIYPK